MASSRTKDNALKKQKKFFENEVRSFKLLEENDVIELGESLTEGRTHDLRMSTRNEQS